MTAVFLHFFNLSVMAGWMVLAVLLLRLCLKKAPRWITCALWGLVALRLVLPFSIESPISLIPSAQTVVSPNGGDSTEPMVDSGVSAIDKPLNDWLQAPVQSPVPQTPPNSQEVPDHNADSAPQIPLIPDTEDTTTPDASTVSRAERMLHIAAPVWLVGIGLMLLYELVSVLRVRRRVLDAVLLRDNVWQSDRVSSPFIFGLFRPRIYIPYGVEEPVLQQVLSHERAHLHRRDHWIKPFAFTLLAVYWYNPLLWVSYILLCRDIEVACDERVVRGLDEDHRRQYATALLQCGVERRSIAACPLAFGEVSIKQRIRSVLSYRKPLLWVIIVSLVACSVAAVCLLTVPREDSLKVLSSQEITPDQVRRFYSTDTDGALVPAGFDWMWEHAENSDQKTPDIDMVDETNIPLVVSRSKADLDALMDACSDDEWDQVDMRDWFELEKYDDTYFEDKVIVWLFVPGYDLGRYSCDVTLEETNQGLRYAVSLQYYSTWMFDPMPDRCEYLLLFETDRKAVRKADSLTTRHQRAPIQVPTEEDNMVTHAVGSADLDGDGEEESMRIFHSPIAMDGAFMVVCKADGTPILREAVEHYYYLQCYLVPQEDGSSLLLFVMADGVDEGACEQFGVLSLKDGERTVVQCEYDGRIYLNNLELGEVVSYVTSLSDWLENAQLLFECENGSLYYGDELGDTPRYTPLCWLDTYRTSDDDTLQDVLENVITSLNGTVTPIGKMDFDQDGQTDSLFVLGYRDGSFDQFCLLVRDVHGPILTTIPIHSHYDSVDKMTYLYRVTDSTGKEQLQKVTLFTDGTCYVSDLSMETDTGYRTMTMTEWLNYVAKTGAKTICYLEGRELYFPDEEPTTGTVKIDLPDYFLAVLQSKQTFVMNKNFFNGEAITLSRLLGKYDDHIGQYTLVDMDEDDVTELVVQFRSLNYNLVIRKDGNRYYGYLFGIRAMHSIHTDGTFYWAEGAGHTGCSRLKFNGDTYELVELWHMDEDASHGNYYVDGKAVTKEAYLAATAKAAPEVAWAEWNESLSISAADKVAIQTYLNDPANNGFLQSYYQYNSQISLKAVFYDGAGVGTTGTIAWSEQEKKDVLAATGWDAFHNPPLKIKRTDANAVLDAKLGRNAYVDDEMYAHFYYLSKYDAFYLMKGDTNYNRVTVKDVTLDDKGRYRVAYTMDNGMKTTNCTVTLSKTETGYIFESNLQDGSTATTSIRTESYTPPASYSGKNVADATGVPYSNVAPKQLTNQMARELVEVLLPRQREVYLLGNVDWENVDETQNCSCSKWFARYTNTKFQSAQDIRDFVHQVYTGDGAEAYLNYLLDGTLDVEQGIFPRFHECDGVLYRSIDAEGKGLNEAERLWDTTHIVWVKGDVVRVEMHARYDETKEYDHVYTFALCKTADGWRTYSGFMDSYYPS